MIGSLTRTEVLLVLALGLFFLAAAPLILLYDLHCGTYRGWV